MPKPSPAVRKALYQAAAGRCRYCGEITFLNELPADADPGRRATIEHIVPRSRGGTNDWQNLALACHRCNVIRAGGRYLPYAELTRAERDQARNHSRLHHRQIHQNPANRRWGRGLRLETIRTLYRASQAGNPPRHPRYAAGAP